MNGSGTRDSRPNFTDHAQPLHRPRADGDARPRRRRGQRRERRLRRGVVSAGCEEHPRRATPRSAPGTNFFKGKASGELRCRRGGPDLRSSSIRTTSAASTIWYHDHTLGMTRLNVYAGPAGFFIVRGGPAGDLALRDTRTGRLAASPAARSERGRPVPAEPELLRDPDRDPGPLVQHRRLAVLPRLARLLRRRCPDPITSFIPDSDVSPIQNPEFFGNMHHGERQHLAVPAGRAAPLPAAAAERLRLAHAGAQVRRPDG